MKNQYFLKDKKCQVYKKEPSTVDKYGIQRKGGIRPISASPLWCYTRQTSQNYGIDSELHLYLNDEDRLFVFNYNKKIEQDDLILYRETWYSVTRVDTTDDYNGEVFVYVKDTPVGDLPKETDILPYKAN